MDVTYIARNEYIQLDDIRVGDLFGVFTGEKNEVKDETVWMKVDTANLVAVRISSPGAGSFLGPALARALKFFAWRVVTQLKVTPY